MKGSFSTDLFQSQWIPASRWIPRSRQKLMVVLHGRGDSLKAFQTIQDELGLPNMNFLLLNARRRFENGFSWCALHPRSESEVKAIRGRLFKLVEELEAAGWPARDIFWLGHSQGCLVACDLVLNHPKAFGGLIGVSGYVRFFRGWKNRAAKSGARRTPWLMTHGTRDRIICPSEIREDIAQLVEGEVPVLYREFQKGHDFDHSKEVPFIRSWIRRANLGRSPAGRSGSRLNRMATWVVAGLLAFSLIAP